MPIDTIPKPSLHVDVRNVRGDVVSDATVTLRPLGKGRQLPLSFDDRIARYVAKAVPSGTWTLDVQHERLQGQTRDVTIGVTPAQESFILGERGRRNVLSRKSTPPGGRRSRPVRG